MKKIIFLFFFLVNFIFANAFAVEAEKTVFAPPNDNCAGAITLPVNAAEACLATTTASFTAATVSGEANTCTAISAKDIWYQFTATATSHSILLSNFTGTPQPIVMGVYEGNCGALTQLYCSQNNVINATALTIGNVYKLRLYFDLANPNLSTAFSICVNTPPPPSDNNQSDCLITTINYDFEQPSHPVGATGPTFVNHNFVQGWRTTASDEMMEFWPSPNYENVPSYSGSQFIELNANLVSAVYQDYQTPQPTVFVYGFAHHGRQGVDTCQLKAGPPGGPYVNVGPAVSTGTTAWSYNTGTYTVPAGQTVTRFLFQSVSSAGGSNSVGNFLDAITFTADNGILSDNPAYMNCGELVLDISAAGSGIWTAHAANPTPTVIADPSANDTTISGFGAAGLYYFDWTTAYCTSTLEVTFTGAEPAEIQVADITYCLGQQASPIVVDPDPGNTLNWYSVIFTGDGPVPDTSVLGTYTYYVSQTTPEGCESVASPVIITVTDAQPAVTDFTLPAAVCAGSGNVTPQTAPEFTTGGTFSSENGLVIDPATGEIDPAVSTLGDYTVTYTIESDPDNCIEGGSSTATITIEAAPVLVPSTALEVCDDDTDGLAEFDLT
ncbi:immunoglobulin domain-containing protein, partial [Flavobacterium rhizosphaerae]